MQNIEINTTQNVHITYEVAHLGDRALAFLIDLLVIGLGALVSMLFSAIVSTSSTSFVFYLIAVPYAAFYTLISEILMKGQTLGKKALKVQIVKLSGVEAKASDYFLRWIFRLIDIY
ncbi:MAG: RDD family protein, partial [Bacteroidota bacterium]